MRVWIEAARPRTLTAAITPVVVGTAAAPTVIWWRFGAALVVALALQVAVNFANDYFDGVKGVDTARRTGPRRAVAAGLITPVAMKRATAASLLVSAAFGIALASAVGPEILVVGLLAIVATLAYSGGRKPYASLGLGEAFVFVFFGQVATVGSTYVQVDRILTVAVLAAVPVGLLAAAILVVNNLRDIETDSAAGKMTLVVRVGKSKTRTLFRALVLGSYPWLPLIATSAGSPWPLLPFASLPLTIPPDRAAQHDSPVTLIAALGQTARLQLIFGLLLALGLWIS